MPSSSWQPVLPSHELRAAENIVAGFLQGEEIALWRSQDGAAQAWENRCPHRGTRLTLGRILEGRLSCAYHGWAFEAGSGACAVIPAQPQAPAPHGVCVKTYRAAEARGMVWVSSRQVETPGPVPSERAQGRFCRSLSVRAGAPAATRALALQGFVETEPFVWQGRLADRDLTLYFTAARPDWILLHLFADANDDGGGLNAILGDARRLRSRIEGELA